MRIYISHLLNDNEMKELIRMTGAGIESIEFSIAENLDRLDESIRSYRKRLQDMGSPRLTMHGPFLDLNPVTFDRGILRVTKLRYQQAYEAAEELSAEKIVFHTCFYPGEYYLTGWAERMTDFLDEFLDGRDDIPVSLENVFDPGWEALRDVAEAVRNERGHANFSLCLDTGHAHCYSDVPVCEWAQNLLPYLSHVHLHDNRGARRDIHLGAGSGTIPWDPLLRTLSSVPDMTYTIECGRKEDVLRTWRLLGRYL